MTPFNVIILTICNCYHFYLIIFPCTYFVLSFMLSFLGCYHLWYYLMLSFLMVSKCYHFYVIIFSCTYFVLSFMLSFIVIMKFTLWKMITSSTLENDNIQAVKSDSIYTWKMIISSTLENENILAFKNDNIYTMKNYNIPYTWKR